jgi:hypothetical protein
MASEGWAGQTGHGTPLKCMLLMEALREIAGRLDNGIVKVLLKVGRGEKKESRALRLSFFPGKGSAYAKAVSGLVTASPPLLFFATQQAIVAFDPDVAGRAAGV